MKGVLQSGVRAFRKIAGQDTAVERFLRQQYKTVKARTERRYFGENYSIFWSGSQRDRRIGFYAFGACHLAAIFSCQGPIRKILDGRACILYAGSVADSRSDVLLQTLERLPGEWVGPAIEKLKLSPDYFEPRLFEKTIIVPGIEGPEEFPKTVIFLSIAADAVRTVYRHRKHGYLVDPGGWWLNRPLDTVLADLSGADWFRNNFTRAGRMTLDVFTENFSRIIRLLREKTGADIVVFNLPTVEAGNVTHNYQFVKNPLTAPMREFNLALVELSRKLNLSIVDVDRILKANGIASQVDFFHFPAERYQPVAQETLRVIQELGII